MIGEFRLTARTPIMRNPAVAHRQCLKLGWQGNQEAAEAIDYLTSSTCSKPSSILNKASLTAKHEAICSGSSNGRHPRIFYEKRRPFDERLESSCRMIIFARMLRQGDLE